MPILGLILLKHKRASNRPVYFVIYARAAGLLAPRPLLQPGDIVCVCSALSQKTQKKNYLSSVSYAQKCGQQLHYFDDFQR